MKKILIVDDQPEVRELVAVTLEIGMYEIFAAEDGMRRFYCKNTGKKQIGRERRIGRFLPTRLIQTAQR